MKVWRKISAFLAMLVLCAGMITMPVSAASDTQDGLKVTLTTDKDTYSQSDEIKVNISVENTNSFDVNNVSLESIIPDGLELKKDYSSSATIGTLTAGDSYKCELVLQQKEESVPVEDDENVDSEDSGEGTSIIEDQSSQISTSIDKNSINQNEKANESDSVQTGDFTSIIPVSIVLVVSVIIIIFLLHKKRNRIFMFFWGIVGSALLFNNGVIDSNAAETVNQRNISVNEIIQVGDNKYELQVNVNYESINDQDDEDSEIIQLTIDQGDFTTVDNTVTLSGTYTGDVTEITYENIPGDQSYGEISRGKVAFSNNKWSFELNVLEIGENNISIIAVDSKGNNTAVSVRIIKEGLYRYSQDDIVTDGETGVSYIRNTIIIFFEDNISPVRENEIVNSISGEIIGKDSFIDEVFVRVPQTDFAGLNGIVEQLENTDGVLTASLDLASSVDVCGEYDTIYPSDGSTNYEDKATWYNEIKASSLSKYQTNSINVGVVDGGFDYWHRDLTLKNISALNSLSEKDHGTHVAGIIGAKHNNFGINGILKKCNIYCYDAVPEGYQTEYKVAHSYLIYGLIRCVENDAKVINYSLTINNETQDDLTQEEKNEQAAYFSKYIYVLRNKDKDFLIVQAAGNGHVGFWNITGRDATNTGAFACITEDNCYSGDAVSEEEILDSIIIVGNAEMVDGKYQLALTSNGGARVDITAPGMNIFSTVENGFGYLSGTSMASPMVTAAAAGIWSMDESVSAAQVKDILLKTADPVVSSNPDAPNAADNGQSTYTFLNIADAVNYVLDAMSGTVSGKVVQEDQSPLNYVSVEVYAENGDRVESGYTDKNGMFTFDLTEGMYEIHFAKSGFENKKMSINIKRGAITALLDPIVMNAKSVGIQGTVVDETGSAISDVSVEIKDSNSDEDITTTTTDENGEFFVALENGEYKITFTKEGYESVTKDNIIVFDGTFKMREIIMRLSGSNNNFISDISSPDETATPIYTVEELLNATEGNYVLAKDLDLSTYNNGVWTPIDTTGNLTLDGQGHIIKNMNITKDIECSGAGLYGASYNYSCTFKNIGFENVSIHSIYNSGVLVGNIGNIYSSAYTDEEEDNAIAVVIDNCYVTGEIDGGRSSGGFIGYIENDTPATTRVTYNTNIVVSNTYSRATIKSEENAGGIIGRLYSTSKNNRYDYGTLTLNISNCLNSGSVTATNNEYIGGGYSSFVGGLVGSYGIYNTNSSVNIQKSSSSNEITGQCSGGKIGKVSIGKEVFIKDCEVAGVVQGYNTAGGIIGDAGGGADATTTNMESCSVSGTVKAPYTLGGLIGVGSIHTNIKQCLMKGTVQNECVTTSRVGGILGETGGFFTTTIYDTDMSGKIIITGERSGTLYLGGILGTFGSNQEVLEIGNCNFTGEVSAPSSEKNIMGGLIGYVSKTCTITETCTFINFKQAVGNSDYDIVNADLIVKLD